MRIVNFSLHGTMWRAPERMRPAPPCVRSGRLAAGGAYTATRPLRRGGGRAGMGGGKGREGGGAPGDCWGGARGAKCKREKKQGRENHSLTRRSLGSKR